MSKGQALQDPFLNALRKERIPVSIYLVNGIKLQCHQNSVRRIAEKFRLADGLQARYFNHRSGAQRQSEFW